MAHLTALNLKDKSAPEKSHWDFQEIFAGYSGGNGALSTAFAPVLQMCKGQQPYFVQTDCVFCSEIVTNSHLVVCDDATVLAPGYSIQTIQSHIVLPSLPYWRGSKS